MVSPLVALMEDQVGAWRDREAGVICLHSGMCASEERETLRRIDHDDWKILYVAPERLTAWHEQGFWLTRRAPDLVALDEFHCVEEWKGFRPAYGELGPAVRSLIDLGARVAAFTATMPVAKARNVLADWRIPVEVVSLPLGRERLGSWLVACEEDAERWLALTGLLGRVRRGAIIYCPSRQATEDIASSLGSLGFSVGAFHAGLPADLRRARVRGFSGGHLNIMVATSAFGMGMDRGDVDLVVHWGLPWSVESLWQEAGRAGRSGEEAHHVLLWNRSDLLRFRHAAHRQAGMRLVDLLLHRGCRKSALAAHFGVTESKCGGCNFCRSRGGEIPGALLPVEKFVDRTPWWLAPEAAPHEWIRKFLKILDGDFSTAYRGFIETQGSSGDRRFSENEN